MIMYKIYAIMPPHTHTHTFSLSLYRSACPSLFHAALNNQLFLDFPGYTSTSLISRRSCSWPPPSACSVTSHRYPPGMLTLQINDWTSQWYVQAVWTSMGECTPELGKERIISLQTVTEVKLHSINLVTMYGCPLRIQEACRDVKKNT